MKVLIEVTSYLRFCRDSTAVAERANYHAKETMINSSYRRRAVSNSLKPLDSGIRNDGKRINQSFLKSYGRSVVAHFY